MYMNGRRHERAGLGRQQEGCAGIIHGANGTDLRVMAASRQLEKGRLGMEVVDNKNDVSVKMILADTNDDKKRYVQSMPSSCLEPREQQTSAAARGTNPQMEAEEASLHTSICSW